MSYLKVSDLFYNLTATQFKMVDSNCEESIFHEGDIAIAENTPENELYLIIKGDVEVPVK